MVVILRGLLLLTAGLVLGACAGGSLPDRILSGYCCAFLTPQGEIRDEGRLARLMDLLATNGFNSIDVKIQQDGDRFFDAARAEGALARLAAEAHRRGLILQIYLYSLPHRATRHPEWPEHAGSRAPTDATGRTIDDAFLLTEAASWSTLYPQAHALAAAQSRIGFDALKFDIERVVERFQVSYDAANRDAFAARHPGKDPIRDEAAYRAFFFTRIRTAVEGFLAPIRAVAPALPLGYMPARRDGEMSELFDAVLATAQAPAISDGWDLYNGEGFRPLVAEHAGLVRARNPQARLVVWLRPDNYGNDDLTVGAYHTASRTDGYSMWSLDMLDDGNARARKAYPLQGANKTADAWAALARANAAIRADRAAGTLGSAGRIALRPVAVRVAPLDLAEVGSFPRLRAARPLAADEKLGEGLVLREQQTVFFVRAAGEPIRVGLAHLAGSARPCALQYALLDPARRVLRNECVRPTRAEEFRVSAPEAGVYALVVSGGRGGQAWYRVRLPGCWCVDARKGTELFGPQTFAVQGRRAGNGVLTVDMTSREAYRCRVDGADPIDCVYQAHSTIPLGEGVTTLAFSRHPATTYCQNFVLKFPKGLAPFVFPAADSAMMVEEN